MKRLSLLLILIMSVNIIWAQKPSDAAGINWQNEIPKVIYPDSEIVALYEKTWEIAADRVRIGPEGLPASPYLDENCYEDQIWIWDSCFMVMFSKYAPAAYPGKQTLDNLYFPIHEDIPTPLRVHLRDNPPLFAWIEHDNYVFTADKGHINYVLREKKFLQRHFEYFNTIPYNDKNEAISPNPIFRKVIKDDSGKIIGFSWTGGASGMDNTPRGRDAGGYYNIMWIDAISQQALSALYISRLSALCGDKKGTKLWKGRYEELKSIINEKYWNEEDGFYYDVDIKSGEHCKIKTPASFWAMLAEIPSKEQAARMVEYMRSDKYMGGKYPWVSLSRDDRDFNGATGDYWRGGIWLPMVYMGTKALEKYGYYELADALAMNVLQQQLRTYKSVEPNTVWECYAPSEDKPSTEHGRRARPDFCGWSALGPISLLIENVMGFREVNALKKQVVWDLKSENGTHGITNLHFGGVVTDIVYNSDTKQIEVKSNTKYKLIIKGKKHNITAGLTILTP